MRLEIWLGMTRAGWYERQKNKKMTEILTLKDKDGNIHRIKKQMTN